MTDAEIKKAIEICAKNSVTRHNGLTYQGMPLHFLFEEILGFVNRQNSNIEELESKNSNLTSDLSSLRTEIERLEKEVDRLSQVVLYHDGQIADAVKEFAERLEGLLVEASSIGYGLDDKRDAVALAEWVADCLTKEFTEGKNNGK